MELIDRLKQIMIDQFDVHDQQQLLDLFQQHQFIDLGIFTKPLQESELHKEGA